MKRYRTAGPWLLALALACPAVAANVEPPAALVKQLAEYRAELAHLRARRSVEPLPADRFFLFGMALREKLYYRDGKLVSLESGKTIAQWSVSECLIVPPAYTVWLRTAQNEAVTISEDAQGVWLEEKGQRKALSLAPVYLPEFRGHVWRNTLRVLHQEILVNVSAAGPSASYLAYDRPWYRDAAMMAMALKRTGNIATIQGWVHNLQSVFDGNNAVPGVPASAREADNPGEVLYLISLTGERNHPLVAEAVKQAQTFRHSALGFTWIEGLTDGGKRPVFQTMWMKFGLRSMGLQDPYTVMPFSDGYAALVWWGDFGWRMPRFRVRTYFDSSRPTHNKYPYLSWAGDHYTGERHGPVSSRDYPLSWERAGQAAHFERVAQVAPGFAAQKVVGPHGWSAAEMMLLLWDRGSAAVGE